MSRKSLFALAAVLLVPLVAAAYTVVLRDGRQIEARAKFVVEGDAVHFVGLDGQAYRFRLAEVNLTATHRANAAARSEAGKTVWTNDELQRLKPSKVSVVGARAAEPAPAPAAEPAAAEGAAAEEEVGAEEAEAEEETPPAEKPKPLPPREKDPQYYRDRLQGARRELADVERQIADLRRNVQSGRGTSSGGVGLLQSNPGVDARDTLQRLEHRREALQGQIAAVEAEARRNGLSPGQIR